MINTQVLIYQIENSSLKVQLNRSDLVTYNDLHLCTVKDTFTFKYPP